MQSWLCAIAAYRFRHADMLTLNKLGLSRVLQGGLFVLHIKTAAGTVTIHSTWAEPDDASITVPATLCEDLAWLFLGNERRPQNDERVPPETSDSRDSV